MLGGSGRGLLHAWVSTQYTAVYMQSMLIVIFAFRGEIGNGRNLNREIRQLGSTSRTVAMRYPGVPATFRFPEVQNASLLTLPRYISPPEPHCVCLHISATKIRSENRQVLTIAFYTFQEWFLRWKSTFPTAFSMLKTEKKNGKKRCLQINACRLKRGLDGFLKRRRYLDGERRQQDHLPKEG